MRRDFLTAPSRFSRFMLPEMSMTKIRLAALRFSSSTGLADHADPQQVVTLAEAGDRAVAVQTEDFVGVPFPAGVERVDEFLDPDGVLGRQHAAAQIVAGHGPRGVVDVHGEGGQGVVLGGDEGVDAGVLEVHQLDLLVVGRLGAAGHRAGAPGPSLAGWARLAGLFGRGRILARVPQLHDDP